MSAKKIHPRDVTVEMWREGTFVVRNCMDDSNRCGVAGPLQYRYEVRLMCSEADLDQHGFLCDSRLINSYWNLKYSNDTPKSAPSCEQLATRGAHDLVHLMDELGVRCSGAEVRIYGGSHSGFTARWGSIPPSRDYPEPGVTCPVPRSDLGIPPEIMDRLLAVVNPLVVINA